MAKEKKDFKKIAVKPSPFDAEMLSNAVQASSAKESDEDPYESVETSEGNDDEYNTVETLKPFATRLPVSLQTRLLQHQYWNRETITDTVINALEIYLKDFPDSNKPLPENVLKKKQSRKKRGQ